MKNDRMLQLYTWSTPNGRKASILLEELGVVYQQIPVNILQGEQFAPDFLALNRNNKIPVLVDPDGPRGQRIVLSESGAILLYLADKYGSSLLPTSAADYWATLQWLMFQMSAVGPSFGQLHHFKRYASEQAYGLDRYGREVHRIYGVLEDRLQKTEFLNGAAYSIADISLYPWIARQELHDIDWSLHKHVRRWFDVVGDRPAVQRGMLLPAAQG